MCPARPPLKGNRGCPGAAGRRPSSIGSASLHKALRLRDSQSTWDPRQTQREKGQMAVSPRAATLPGSPRSNQQMDILRGYHIPPAAAAAAKSLHSWPTLCDPIDGSPPGSSVPGILQARTLEWGAVPFSNYMPITVLRTGGWGRGCLLGAH